MAASPAPPLAEALERHWRRYAWELRRLQREGPSEPAVHDCRVAARRLMTLLRVVQRVAPGHGAGGLRRRVRRTFGTLARLRDVQVEQALAAERAGQHPVLERLVRRLRREEKQLRPSARAAANARDLRDQERRFTGLLHAWERPQEGAAGKAGAGRVPATRAVQHELQRELHARARAVAERNAAAADGNPDTVHQVRVALKQFRYLLEAARGLDGGALAAPLARARRWQGRLGHLQDLRVLRDDAAVLAKAHPDPAWEAALATLEAELTTDTRAYLAVRNRLTALVRPFGGGVRRQPAV